MQLKDGVNYLGVNPKIWEALWKADKIYSDVDKELVITSLREGEHSRKRSAHYRGDAADLRTFYFTDDIKEQVTKTLKTELGDDYVVVLEKDHIHFHWSPVYKSERY